jgi:hypothetical protein
VVIVAWMAVGDAQVSHVILRSFEACPILPDDAVLIHRHIAALTEEAALSRARLNYGAISAEVNQPATSFPRYANRALRAVLRVGLLPSTDETDTHSARPQ